MNDRDETEMTAEDQLRELEKEFGCLASIAEILSMPALSLAESLARIVNLLPSAWRSPDKTRAEIAVHEIRVVSDPPNEAIAKDRPGVLERPLISAGRELGAITVAVDLAPHELEALSLTPEPGGTVGFLTSEIRLLETAADIIAHLVLKNETEKKIAENEQLLESKNAALKEVFDYIRSEQRSEQELYRVHLHSVVLPLVLKLRSGSTSSAQRELVLSSLERAVRGFDLTTERNAEGIAARLTPRELEIAVAIRNGLSSKEIALTLNLSELTVERHRHNMRRKLGLAGKPVNLTTYLRSVQSL